MLAERHARELTLGSGLTDGIIAQRGYDTITTAKDLEALGFNNGQSQLFPSLLIPLHWNGEVVQHQIKPDKPRVPKDAKKAAKYETPAGSQPRLDCHPSNWAALRDPKIPLWITEGLKKADSGTARGLCVIGLIGVYGFLGRNDKGGVCTLSEWDDVPLKKRLTYICLDSDAWTNPNVQAAMIRLGRFLKKRGAKVVYIRLQPSGDAKVGMDDYWMLPGSSPEALAQMVGDPEEEFSIGTESRGLDEITGDAIDALVRANEPPSLFVRDSDIVMVSTNERGLTSIVAPGVSQLRLLMAECSRWHNKRGQCAPPREVAESVFGRRNLPFPAIVGVTKGPLLSSSGQITTEPGYCPHSRMWLDSQGIVPFKGSAEAAALWLRKEVFDGFTFASPADWAHTLCLALLPVVRPIIQGSTPLHLIGAPVQGSGKGKLAKACLMMTQGNQIAPTPMRANEEEIRKHITSSIRAGKNYIMIDNVTNSLASATLAVMLTAGEWEDRILGGNSLFQAEVTQILVATANNPVLDKDMLRRSVRIWIDPGVEHPEDRTFARDPERWVCHHRPEVQGALVAIVAGWVAGGMKPQTEVTYGSFEDWAGVMGGILGAAGVEGFLSNVHEMREQSGSMEDAWARFYVRWERQYGYDALAVAALWDVWMQDDELQSLIRDGSDRGVRVQFGLLLRSRVGMVCAGLRIERTRGSSDGAAGYRLTRNSQAETAERLIDLDANEPLGTDGAVRI